MPKKQTLKQSGTILLHGTEVPSATYKTVEGDTVFSLWAQFRKQTTVGAIKIANTLVVNELVAGKTLKIPLVFL